MRARPCGGAGAWAGQGVCCAWAVGPPARPERGAGSVQRVQPGGRRARGQPNRREWSDRRRFLRLGGPGRAGHGRRRRGGLPPPARRSPALRRSGQTGRATPRCRPICSTCSTWWPNWSCAETFGKGLEGELVGGAGRVGPDRRRAAGSSSPTRGVASTSRRSPPTPRMHVAVLRNTPARPRPGRPRLDLDAGFGSIAATVGPGPSVDSGSTCSPASRTSCSARSWSPTCP